LLIKYFDNNNYLLNDKVPVMKVFILIFFISIFAGCGAIGPTLQGVSGSMVFLEESNPDRSSCGFHLDQYFIQANLTCQQIGYKNVKLHATNNSKNPYCADRLIAAIFICY